LTARKKKLKLKLKLILNLHGNTEAGTGMAEEVFSGIPIIVIWEEFVED